MASPHSVVVLGASAGGVSALSVIAATLDPKLDAAVVVVLHVAAEGSSVLDQILGRQSTLDVVCAEDGAPLEAGRIYVAPPDHHVLVGTQALRLTRGPRENGHRPAVDPTMRSAARAFGPRAIGVVLSGTRDDGSAGLLSIQQAGGATFVQDPGEALYGAMPRNAMATVAVDGVLPLREIAPRLLELARRRGPEAVSSGGPDALESPLAIAGAPGTRFTCPDCGGVLFEDPESGAAMHLRCSVGHAHSAEAVFAEHGRALEHALSTAVRTLENQAVMMDRMHARADAHPQADSARSFASQADEARERAALIRRVLALPQPTDAQPA